VNKCLIGSAIISLFLVAGSPNMTQAGVKNIQVKETAANVTASFQTNAISMVKPNIGLDSVNGVSLYDDKQAIIDKLGVPLTIHANPALSRTEEYDYGYMQVCFDNGEIVYVSVPATAQTVLLDGTEVPLTNSGLNQALGRIDFEAEDGSVYVRGSLALKAYCDPATGELVNIHYFHDTGI
jgi:hypothetical protein